MTPQVPPRDHISPYLCALKRVSIRSLYTSRQNDVDHQHSTRPYTTSASSPTSCDFYYKLTAFPNCQDVKLYAAQSHAHRGVRKTGAVHHVDSARYAANRNNRKYILTVNAEIDSNFSRAHRIVTTSILPIVEQYAEHSKDVWEGAKVRLPSSPEEPWD